MLRRGDLRAALPGDELARMRDLDVPRAEPLAECLLIAPQDGNVDVGMRPRVMPHEQVEPSSAGDPPGRGHAVEKPLHVLERERLPAMLRRRRRGFGVLHQNPELYT